MDPMRTEFKVNCNLMKILFKPMEIEIIPSTSIEFELEFLDRSSEIEVENAMRTIRIELNSFFKSIETQLNFNSKSVRIE